MLRVIAQSARIIRLNDEGEDTLKGLVLSGGKGTRLYPLTYTRAKQLIPVANKPILFRVIEAIRDAGITEIGVVTGDTAAEIQEAVGNGSRWGVEITYIPQEAPLGLAHAVKIARDFIGDERFVMFLGDNVIQGGISPLIADFANHPEWNSQIVLTRVHRPEQYGVAELTSDGRVARLIEKPQQPPSNLALVGIYMFDQHIFQATEEIQPSFRGELEITDAIQWLIDHGYTVYPHIHKGWWIDTGRPDDMLTANSHVLDELKPHVHGYVDSGSQVDSRVTIERGAQIVNSVVRGPAIIGENTKIINSYIGPFTSIYHDVVVENSEIERSIVLEHSSICNIPTRLQDSLIGRHAQVGISAARPKTIKLHLGDHSRLELI
jgi:glucose-1-phosphate thymidylyltransferase